MKLLFDQNLSHRLAARRSDIFPESAHVRALGMDKSSDTAIWNHARRNDFVIVTQDSDFAERSKLFDAPPKVVWLRCGNTTAKAIENLLREHAAAIIELSRDDTWPYVEIFD